jgi:hypothetical protein
MPSVKLAIPYKSQWDPDAKDHHADCGPTSLSMLLAALGDAVSPDQLYRHIGERGVSQYTSFTDLINAAKARNLPMTRKNFMPATAFDELKKTLDSAMPFVALVNYAFWDPIVKNGFRGSHFVLVVGYDDQKVYIHDPLFKGSRRDQGQYCAYTHDQFLDAWGGFAPGQNPNYAALISGKQVSFFEGAAAAPAARQPAQPAAPQIDETMRRRIRAREAYDGFPDPNLADPAIAQNLMARIGNFGATWDVYTVRRGDSLSKIATIFYGDREKWPVIVYFNNIANPSRVQPGDTCLIPRPELTPGTDAHVPLPGFGGPTG